MFSSADIETLASSVTGAVLVPESPGYAEEILAFNLATVHTPDAVLAATNAADVVAAVRWAGALGVPVSVQATGHGAADRIENGLLISTRRMQDLYIDPVERTAQVGAGVKWRTLLAASVPHGLIGLNGSSTDAGVVGYTLGGGLPVLGRAYGFAADHVRSFEIVTPDGVLRQVDADHEPDLFALLRGGKGNFGIVTSLVCNLLPVDDFYGGGIIYPGSDAESVLDAFARWWPTLPDEAAPSISLLRLPDLEFVPPPLREQFVIHLRFAFAGAREEAEAMLAPMRAVSTPLMDMAAPMSYLDVDMVHMDPQDPLPYEEAGALLSDFGKEARNVLLQQAGPDMESPLLMIEVRPLGGALSKSRLGMDAVSGRDAAFSMLAIGLMVPPVDALVPGALRALFEAMKPWSTGRTLVNFHGRAGDAIDRSRAWSAETYDKLQAAKSHYDPANMLRFGHAIMAAAVAPDVTAAVSPGMADSGS